MSFNIIILQNHKKRFHLCAGGNHFVFDIHFSTLNHARDINNVFMCTQKKRKDVILKVIFCFTNLKVKYIK